MGAASVNQVQGCEFSSLIVVTVDGNGFAPFLVTFQIDDGNFELLQVLGAYIFTAQDNARGVV